MKSSVPFVLMLVSLMASGASASVFLPKTMEVKTGSRVFHPLHAAASTKGDFRSILRQQRRASSKSTAMAIPGYGVAEQIFVGGFQNFLSIVSVPTEGVYCAWNGKLSHKSLYAHCYSIMLSLLLVFF